MGESIKAILALLLIVSLIARTHRPCSVTRAPSGRG
jgi:hypothetical protein